MFCELHKIFIVVFVCLCDMDTEKVLGSTSVSLRGLTSTVSGGVPLEQVSRDVSKNLGEMYVAGMKEYLFGSGITGNALDTIRGYDAAVVVDTAGIREGKKQLSPLYAFVILCVCL